MGRFSSSKNFVVLVTLPVRHVVQEITELTNGTLWKCLIMIENRLVWLVLWILQNLSWCKLELFFPCYGSVIPWFSSVSNWICLCLDGVMWAWIRGTLGDSYTGHVVDRRITPPWASGGLIALGPTNDGPQHVRVRRSTQSLWATFARKEAHTSQSAADGGHSRKRALGEHGEATIGGWRRLPSYFPADSPSRAPRRHQLTPATASEGR